MDDAREGRAALRRLGRRGRGRRRRRGAAPARVRRASRVDWDEADRVRDRAAHAAVRDGAGGPGDRRALGSRTASGEIMAAGRFGIPAMVHEECLAGRAAWRATVYPAPLSWGASFDPALVEALGRRIGAHDARGSASTGARAGAGRRPRPAVGPGRGDDRRGPAGSWARIGAAYVRGLRGRRRHRDAQALRRVLRRSRAGREPRAGGGRAAGDGRRAAAAVRARRCAPARGR